MAWVGLLGGLPSTEREPLLCSKITISQSCGRGKESFLTSSQGTTRISLGQEVLDQEHGFQLLAMYIRILARKPQQKGHTFIRQIFIRHLLCIRHSTKVWVDKDE